MSPRRARTAPPSAGSDHSGDPTPEQLATAAAAFALLADPTRLAILWSLRTGPADVGALAEAARCRPPAASQHLAKLRLAGLVEGRREGRRVQYSLRGGHVRGLLEEGLAAAHHAVTGELTHA